MDLFASDNETEAGYRPLADRMRPRTLAEFAGQPQITGDGKPLRRAIDEDKLHSMVFWGPPGTGKTTLAKLIARSCGAQFFSVSAVLSGVKDIRAAVDQAKMHKQQHQRPSVLFVDEVHRFNKAQQDAFLPHVEDGTVFFLGATTENPSFELNNALLSRVRVYVFKSLAANDIRSVIDAALNDEERGFGGEAINITPELRDQLAQAADGDARRALNLLEISVDLAESGEITEETIREVTAQSTRRFDKGGDLFYDQISAVHKAVRGSDPDAALYWLCRMLDGGCDPRYIARRVVRIASEDIGNADPRALQLTLDAWQAYERLGTPEGELAIAQAVVYLASVPKSNAVYAAFNEAMAQARESGTLDVPEHLRNAPTQLMKDLGHGQDYRYAHNEQDGFAAGENYFPEELKGTRYYHPVDRGLEAKIRERLERLRGKE